MSAELKPVRITINLPVKLLPLAQRRQRDEGYRSLSEYGKWLIFFDIMARRKHRGTPYLMRQDEAYQNRVYDELIQNFDAQDNRVGGWMEAMIKEAAKEMITAGEVDDLVRERAAKFKQRDENGTH